MENILEIEGVSKAYGQHKALSDVTMCVRRGCLFGLLGPNGAGKTTLIRIVNQIFTADSGRILFDGSLLSAVHQSRIGYLPEERGLYRSMKVGEQALYLAGLKGLGEMEAKRALKYWFERLDIMGWWDKKVEELSKGMAQKVQFAITVLHEPELLILDEPFSGFDPVNEGVIRDELMELHRRGTTIIFSTHRMDTVEELCEDIVLIDRSKVVLSGPLGSIKKQFARKEWEIVVRASTGMDLPVVSGYECEKLGQPNGDMVVRVMDRENKGINEFLTALLATGTGQVQAVREILPAMKEIFIDVVKNQRDE
ncbi:ABC transporter ATP-binding protein [Schleiferia thermophila]|jgi:ABC-2 type transport system ATP-binding protein|uniref:ABC-2 type transport system ATP-binding protein n=1 Tax=Schleiferia thermophila TaxID=884107 RepID=A0A368ZZ62_9FLAO|nr:ATP-binding cassette domain-containing protein [Schleiferia thermophila]KFD38173.1 ABC transporter ATP-binding protein [Schleiferia thermophila str. Yellowstone]PMB38155.1 ABC transporter ATP-binding protein [Fischerella thermalis CCMEE 5319]RCX02312.1 ABC-2 type transport system ATP-binding protein [Schleiferia thermophila]